MILQFEWNGADTTGSGYTFQLETPLNFTKLVLKSVVVYGSSSLDASTPLYLNANFLGQHHALLAPATFSDGTGRVNSVNNDRIAVGTIGDLGVVQQLDLVLIDGESHWEHGKELVMSLSHRAVDSETLAYGAITALGGSDFTDDMRVLVTFETVGGSQAPQSAS